MAKQGLTALIDLIETDQKTIGKKLIEELIFMQSVLKELKQTIKKEGVVDTSDGKAKESPAIKSYNQTVKSYGNLLKQVEMLVRRAGVKIGEGEDALKNWLEAQNRGQK